MQKAPRKYFAVFASSTVIMFVIAFLVPFSMGVYLPFAKFVTVTDAEQMSTDNYVRMFSDSNLLNTLGFTAKFTAVPVIAVSVLVLLPALPFTRGICGTNAFRTAFFMSNLIGGIVLGYIWQLSINDVLLKFGVDIAFDVGYGFWGLAVLMNWQMIGYMMTIYTAGIQNIPGDVVEVAQVDGAIPRQALFYVTIPLVMPSFTICAFLTLTNPSKLFDQSFALTGGAPAWQNAIPALDISNSFYGCMGCEGVDQAKAVMPFLLVVGIALVQLMVTRSGEVGNRWRIPQKELIPFCLSPL